MGSDSTTVSFAPLQRPTGVSPPGSARCHAPTSAIGPPGGVKLTGCIAANLATVTARAEHCSFPGCRRPGRDTVRFAVGGADHVLPVCASHAAWLRSYAEEDQAVRIIDSLTVSGPDQGTDAHSET